MQTTAQVNLQGKEQRFCCSQAHGETELANGGRKVQQQGRAVALSGCR